jgi:hypothetical protein
LSANRAPRILFGLAGLFAAAGAGALVVAFTRHYTDVGFVVNAVFELAGIAALVLAALCLLAGLLARRHSW